VGLRQRVGRYARTRVPPLRGVRRDSRVALDPPYQRPVLDPPYRHAPSDGPNQPALRQRVGLRQRV